MYSFTSLYSSITNICAIVGFIFPVKLQCLKTHKYPFSEAYIILTMIPDVYMIVCNFILLCTDGFLNMRVHGLNTFLILVVFETSYQLYYKQDFNRLLENFDNITRGVLNSDLIETKDVAYILQKAKAFNSYTRYIFIFTCLQLILYIVNTLDNHFLYSKDYMDISVPYSVESHSLFLLTFIVQAGFMLFTIPRPISSRCIIFFLLYHVMFYMKVLRKSLDMRFDMATETRGKYEKNREPLEKFLTGKNKTVGADDKRRRYFMNRLKVWMELHESIIRYLFGTVITFSQIVMNMK